MAPDTHFQGRVVQADGTPDLADADVAISAGWGTTATKSVIADSSDRRMRIQVASAGTGQGADPTITITFKQSFSKAPFAVASRADVAAAAGDFRVTGRTTTTLTLTFKGTPVAAQTYLVDLIVEP